MRSVVANIILAVTTTVSAASCSRPTLAKLAAAAANSTRPTFFNNTCTAETMKIRKEWRSLVTDEKTAYLEAVNCLMELPANTTLSGVTNRFSDLQAPHRDKTNATVNDVYVGDIIHSVVSDCRRWDISFPLSHLNHGLIGTILSLAPLVHLRPRANAAQ
jgi:hypothetical protein